MRPSTVLLLLAANVGLVALGLIAYDGLRSDRANPLGSPAAATPSGPLRRLADGPELEPAPGALPDAVRALETRVERLEEGLAALRLAADEARRGGPPGAPAPAPAPGGSVPAGTSSDSGVGPGDPGAPTEFSPEEVRKFRALEQHVHDLEDQERKAHIAEDWYAKTGADLDPDTRHEVISAIMEFRQRTIAAMVQTSETARTEEERARAIEDARKAYWDRIRRAAPSEQAEKILSAIGHFPGLERYDAGYRR